MTDDLKSLLVVLRLSGLKLRPGLTPTCPCYAKTSPHGKTTTRLFMSNDFPGTVIIACENHLPGYLQAHQEIFL